MTKSIKAIIKPLVPDWLLHTKRHATKKYQEQKHLNIWKKNGCPIPPPHIVKQMAVAHYRKLTGYDVFIETGTYLGEMVEAQKKKFRKIYSIELGIDLFKNAKERFIHDTNIIIIHGDSGKVLPKVLSGINEPAIFWLDGHYSAGITAKGEKECPIFEELHAIFHNRVFEHVLLIDDARFFNGKGDYPTLDELKEFVFSKNKKYHFEVKDDIIRFWV
jgi:hypothetical protein